MSERAYVDLSSVRERLSIVERPGATVDGGGGSGDDGGMDHRITVLETKLETVLPTLATKTDIADVRGAMQTGFAEVRADFHQNTVSTTRWMIATVIGLFIGFGSLFIAITNTLKPAPISGQAQVNTTATGTLQPAPSPAPTPTK